VLNRTGIGAGWALAATFWMAACGRSSMPLPTTADGTLSLSGTAAEVAPSAHVLPGVHILITDGPGAGRETTTDAGGTFRLTALPSGMIGIVATKDGYFPWRVMNLSVDTYHEIQIVMYPQTPRDASGTPATARCNDGTWSWDTSLDGLCATHGGVAYTACPGPLCVH